MNQNRGVINSDNEKIIRYVALYLRKSRGEDETALDKHKLMLTELCKENNWKYVEYKEIVSGESIEMRPIFKQLLEDISNDLYDAVVVADIDRLGRGNQSDQGKINQAFAISNTYIITPQQVYNLNDDDDEFIVDMKGFISRREYKQIVKRLSQGKKIGSRMGNWTNGTPPYPYEYEKYNNKFNEKGLVVNEDKLKIYRYIINSVINDNKTPKQISIELNNRKIPSPRNGLWHGNTIYRLLLDETHLGNIIANKTKGDGHKKKKLNSKPVEYIPKEKWVIVHNCHEAIKTQDEHDQILLFASRLTNMPKRTQNNIMPLSGLIKCKKCGHTMGVYRRNDRNMSDVLKPCWYTDLYGKKCNNSGMKLDTLYEYILNDIDNYQEILLKQVNDNNVSENRKSIEQKILLLEEEINKNNKTIERMLDGFENGLYTIDQFKERKNKINIIVEKLQQEYDILKKQWNNISTDELEIKLEKIKNFKIKFYSKNISDEQINREFKSIINYIEWGRNGNDISIYVDYK